MNDHAKVADLQVIDRLDRTETRRSHKTHEEPASEGVPADKAQKPNRSRLKRFLFGVAALGVVGYGVHYGWQYWTVGRFQESTDDAYVKADSTIIAPKVSGYLRAVLVDDNQAVRANQPLAQIDDRDYAVALKQAGANVDAARATIDNVRANIDQQQAVIEQAQSTVSLDQANLTFAQQDNDRYVTLAKGGAGSIQSAQQAISKFNIAKATLQRDAAAVVAAEKQVGSLKAQLAKAAADLAQQQAVEEQARLNISYTTIVAPMDGVVGNRTLRVGQYVQAGTALMGVVPLSAVYIVANFKETQLTHVRRGQPVDIDVDGFPDHALKGNVDSIAPASGQEFALLPPDNATGNFTKIVQRVPVKIKIPADNPLAGLLLPGMSVVPTINTKGE
jgi:membrane fusion protein, multidrug efflux system